MLSKAISTSSAQPQVIAAAAYRHGKRVADIQIDEAGDWAKREGHVAWIGLQEPDIDLLRKIQLQFDLHPLAIEDALKAHQRPKLELYGESLFAVASRCFPCQITIAAGCERQIRSSARSSRN